MNLANALANLARITANLANRQQRFEDLMISYNQQLMEQQIITTRRSIEDRKLIMSENARQTQREIDNKLSED